MYKYVQVERDSTPMEAVPFSFLTYMRVRDHSTILLYGFGFSIPIVSNKIAINLAAQSTAFSLSRLPFDNAVKISSASL